MNPHQAQSPNPKPEADPVATLIGIIREPLTALNFDVEHLISQIPTPIPATLLNAADRITPGLVMLSAKVRQERYLGFCVSLGCLPISQKDHDTLKASQAVLALKHADERSAAIIKVQYPDISSELIALSMNALSKPLTAEFHAAAFYIGRIIGAIIPSHYTLWTEVRPLIKACSHSDFVIAESDGRIESESVPISAMELVFDGIVTQLSETSTLDDRFISRILIDFKDLGEPVYHSRIPKLARECIADLADKAPAIFDGAISEVLLRPAQARLMASASSNQRRLQFVETAVQTLFGISELGFLPWHNMPLCGPVVRDICNNELNLLMDSDQSSSVGQESKDDPLEALFRSTQLSAAMNNVRLWGFTTGEIVERLLITLQADNDSLQSATTQTARILGEQEPAQDHPGDSQRPFLDIYLRTLLARDVDRSLEKLVPELKRHCLEYGKYSDECSHLLFRINRSEFSALAEIFNRRIAETSKISSLADLARYAADLDSAKKFKLVTSLPLFDLSGFVDPDFGAERSDSEFVAVNVAISDPGLWIDLLESDEDLAMRRIIEATVYLTNEPSDQQIAAGVTLLKHELAMNVIAWTASLIDDSECAALIASTWSKLNDRAQERFLDRIAISLSDGSRFGCVAQTILSREPSSRIVSRLTSLYRNMITSQIDSWNKHHRI